MNRGTVGLEPKHLSLFQTIINRNHFLHRLILVPIFWTVEPRVLNRNRLGTEPWTRIVISEIMFNEGNIHIFSNIVAIANLWDSCTTALSPRALCGAFLFTINFYLDAYFSYFILRHVLIILRYIYTLHVWNF